MNSAVRAVIFDYGNVLCPMPSQDAFDGLARVAGIQSGEFLASLWRYRLDYDRGTLDGPAYWRQIAKDHQRQFSDAQIGRLIQIDLSLWTTPGSALLEWARTLRRNGLKTSILSNMPRDFSSYLRAHSPWLNDFDHTVFSGELGMVKPDARIFETCLTGLGVAPAEALFIDDMALNVESARAGGINAIRFESLAQLAVEIQPYALPAVGA